ncbi:MAG TPA: TonB-dependent receptor [Candidatus Eisenbacteria bacterium]|jgi:outer membrane receptor protein involved in Fe transport
MSGRVVRATGLLAAVLCVALASAPAWSGTTGKLAGRVLDEKNQPLAGVNVRVEGQPLGAISDDGGNYFIIGIPAATYVVRANLMGYAAFVAEGVSIAPDFTTSLDIHLKTQAVQLGEVKVEAERPLLQRDATSTTRFISADDIARLPTRGYRDAAAQQSGVVAFQRLIDRESQNGPTLIIRGGRPNETAYYVDGYSQQDPLTGNATTSINNDAIQEVVLLNGGFNAEYGRIMSGVVNVITKEGRSKYNGNVEGLTDNFGGTGNKFMGSRVYDYNIYGANFSGPLLPGRDAGTFYLSGERRWEGDRRPSSIFDGPLPSNSLSGWTGQGKLTIPLQKQMNLKFGVLGSNDDWREYLNTYRYNLIHAPRYRDVNRSVTGQFNHTLSARSFYSLGGSWFYTERKRGDGVFFDNIGLYGSVPQPDFDLAIPWFWPGTSDPRSPVGHVLDSLARINGGTGHVWDDYLRRQSQYWAIKGDYTTQWNPFHQIKGGFEYDQHTLRYYDHYFPVNFAVDKDDIDRYGFTEDGRSHQNGGRDGPREPKTGSLYLQDKYERLGLVFNAGLRYDYINVDTRALKSEQFPLGRGPSYTLADSNLTGSKTYNRVSPRLGIGFPITDRTVMHANWGQFYQQPNLQDLYVSYRFLEYKILHTGYFVGFGNPNLKPEQTQAYEVGIAHLLGEYAKVDVTTYYKDVKDLVEVQAIGSKPNGFTSYRNADFATIKGLDLGFTLRRVNHLQANLAYSLSYAVGTGSVSNSSANPAWYGSEIPKQTAPLDFDQRHKISVNLDYLFGSGEGPALGGRRVLEHSSLNVLWNIASGTPYTQTEIYDEAGLAALAKQPVGPLNSRYGPWTQSLDFKLSRGFNIAGLDVSAYAWVLNALDTKNAIGVFTGTGSPFTTGFLESPSGQAAAENLQSKYGLPIAPAYAQAVQNQALFSSPRLIRFGMRVGF